MLQNHRPYQLIRSKTGSSLLASAVARAAACYGAARLSLASLHREDASLLPTPEQARAALQTIYPKPLPSEPISPLPPQDAQIELSIIVPSYNVERYIDRCIQSILSQEGSEHLQVIVVDGDSTDRTLERLFAYRNDPRVVVIPTKGRSSAARGRNEGLLHATGQYLMFVDSDDQLAPGAVKALLDTARQTGADIVQGGWQYLDEADTPGPQQLYLDMTYTGAHALDRFDLPGMPWGKVYRRALFEHIRFPDHYSCFEDTILHFLVYRSAEKIVSSSALVYFWRRNSRGITASSQHRPAAVQSYWIMEELLCQDARLKLPHDALFDACFVMQLTNCCYANLSRMEPSTQRAVFALCCDLYARTMQKDPTEGQSFAVRCGAKALRERRFDLWCRQGQLFRLL